jgi:hypothetical protein
MGSVLDLDAHDQSVRPRVGSLREPELEIDTIPPDRDRVLTRRRALAGIRSSASQAPSVGPARSPEPAWFWPGSCQIFARKYPSSGTRRSTAAKLSVKRSSRGTRSLLATSLETSPNSDGG